LTTTTVVSDKKMINSPVYLNVGQTSGSFKISIPFMAEYIMVLNDTAATIAVCTGEQSTQTPESQLWTPGKYISMPLVEQTQKLTVFWTSEQPIAIDNNLVQFYFSNVTIPLQGGNYGAAASSQDVHVLNTVTTQFAAPPHVNVDALPALPSGTNNIGSVNKVIQGSLSDHSGTIITDSTAQQAAAANASRRFLLLQNVSTADLWFDFGVNAVLSQPSIKLAAGEKMIFTEFVPTDFISVIGGTAAQGFTVKEG
jgi:hypothetical protein